MNEKILNDIENKIISFNKKYGLNLELIASSSKGNENTFAVRGNMSNLTQIQGNELENLFVELGCYYTNCRSEFEFSSDNYKTEIWEFVVK